MKRVLIISYYWPPTGGSGVQRWVKFAKYLPGEGWQPVVYTPLNPERLVTDEKLGAEVPPEAEVIRRKITEPYRVYRFLLGRRDASRGGSDEVNPANAGRKTLMQRFSVWVRGNLFIPDPRCLWIRPSVRFLKKYLKEHPVDIIVSSGPPQSMHLIARRLALATGLPWIADFRDPWTKIFYFKHLSMSRRARRRHEKLERQVLDDASAVVAVSPLVQEDFRAMTSTPVELITNGFDEDDFAIETKGDAGANGLEYFNITHTGLFAADGNPEVLWKVLAEKCAAEPEFGKQLRIRLVGKTDSAVIDSVKAAGLAGNLVDRGYVPHDEAVREQRGSSVLMLPLRREPEYKAVLPGKVFEYLAAGRPVLGIGQPDGAMAALLADAKAGIVADWDDAPAVAAFIDRCWSAFLSGIPLSGAADVSRYSRRRLTKDYVNLMDFLLENK
ncbi:MAG: glycosyltransferase family 4 protein [Bacteroidales bacterium]|nr:glycosyltransferase family 4 protein [Bacteroidales bacterium]